MTRNARSLYNVESEYHGHSPRVFIGPMPVATAKKIVPQIGRTKKHWWSRVRRRNRAQDEDVNEGEWDEEDVPDTEAFRFFIHRGGKREEWSASGALRKRVKREMIKVIQQSGWANLFHHGQKNVQTPSQKWIGDTFVIGKDFLGLPLEHHTSNLINEMPSISPPQPPSEPDDVFTVSRDTENAHDPESVIRNSNAFSALSASSTNNGFPGPSNSTTALLRPLPSAPVLPSSSERPVTPDPSTPPRPHRASKSAPGVIRLPSSPLRSLYQTSPHKNSDVGRSVQFANAGGPASPGRVLNRAIDAVPHTSAEASQRNRPSAQVDDSDSTGQDVVRRERMLVRKGYSKSGRVGRYFSAVEASSLRNLRSYEWQEYLVVWRKRQLELYEDYMIPGKEKLLGHKHLACSIPLDTAKTRVFPYSFIDMTFCLTCTEPSVMKGKNQSLADRIPFLRSNGTYVFVFKTKIRTSGIDWLWDLWNELGYELPRTLEIHCPLVDAFVRLRIPEQGIKTPNDIPFSKESVIQRCCTGLKALPSWNFQIEQRLEKGASLELSWRHEAVLDQIRYETDLNGRTRDASVLYGVCLKRPYELTQLELRVGEHRPSYVMKDAQQIFEPAPIEGYLYRIKSTNNTRVQVYMSVHTGCLFTIPPARAHPPIPPFPTSADAFGHDPDKGTKLSFREEERRRGAAQVLHSDLLLDIRKIAAVRRAFQRIDSFRDESDIGGDEGLNKHPDIPKHHMRIRRSFELLMYNGRVYRFETYSCSVARQWVNRLGELVEYWTQRHRMDATQEMKIMNAFSNKKDLRYSLGTPQLQPVDPQHIVEDISLFWDCCSLYGCHSITRTGRLFVRRKLKGLYSLVQFALVTGHMIQFDIVSTGQNPRSSAISLLDAYVCSGHFATQSLSVNEFSTTKPPLPRRFQDGLESEDHELDLVFLVWYRPHAPKKALTDESGAAVPTINAKHKVIVLKARSKLERDAWCCAINDEIERTARHHVSRELKSRLGGLASP